jgi:hypothetical protein
VQELDVDVEVVLVVGVEAGQVGPQLHAEM